MKRPDQRRHELSPQSKLERFGPGPWVTEPDSVEFEAHGLQCRVLRHPEMGFFCGYVAVPSRHPLHGLHYDDVLLADVDVHGGLTFADYYSRLSDVEEPEPRAWWFGFDCGHCWDLAPGMAGMLGRIRQDPIFDQLPAHNRMDVYRDVQYVYAQCVELAEQLMAAGAVEHNSATFCRGCKSTRTLRLVELKRARVYLCGRCRAVRRAEQSARHMREMVAWSKAQMAKRARIAVAN